MARKWRTIDLRGATVGQSSDEDVVVVRGTARERGERYGAAARDKIEVNLRVLDALVADHSDISWEAFDNVVQLNKQFACAQDPELADSVAGIAKGAGADEHAIWSLNLPAHFLLGHLAQECSQLFVSRPGGRFLAKTRDFSKERSFLQTAVVVDRGHGVRSVGVHTSGSLTWPGSGLSSSGVAYSTSGVWSPRVQGEPGRVSSAWLLFNGDIVARSARSAAEFAGRAAAQRRMVGINAIAADATDAFSIELADLDARITANDDALVLTNHYVAQGGTFGRIGPKPDEYPNTYDRAEYLSRQAACLATGAIDEVERLLDAAPVNRDRDVSSTATTEYVSVADINSRTLYLTIAH